MFSIDLAILSFNLLDEIQEFKVLDTPTTFNHNSIAVTLRHNDRTLKSKESTLKWREEAAQDFSQQMQCNPRVGHIDQDPTDMYNNLL